MFRRDTFLRQTACRSTRRWRPSRSSPHRPVHRPTIPNYPKHPVHRPTISYIAPPSRTSPRHLIVRPPVLPTNPPSRSFFPLIHASNQLTHRCAVVFTDQPIAVSAERTTSFSPSVRAGFQLSPLRAAGPGSSALLSERQGWFPAPISPSDRAGCQRPSLRASGPASSFPLSKRPGRLPAPISPSDRTWFQRPSLRAAGPASSATKLSSNEVVNYVKSRSGTDDGLEG